MNDVKKPTVGLSRDNYSFVLSFGHLDSRLTNTNDYQGGRHYINGKICIEREVHIKGSSKIMDKKTVEIGAGNSSWTYKLDKNEYYPFVSKGESLNCRISKIVFRVWVKFDERYKTTSPGGQYIGYGYKTKKSEKVTKTYVMEAAVKPTVAIGYTEDGTSLSFGIYLNSNYAIGTNTRKVSTRCWGYLTRQILGKKEKIVSGFKGKWYNLEENNRSVNRISFKNDISGFDDFKTPVKYTIRAYCAGPGGRSEMVKRTHIFAVPKIQSAPSVIKKNIGFYGVKWHIDTSNGWRPVDSVSIEYCDSTSFITDGYGDGSWSTAKENINYKITSIMTNDIGKPAADSARYFRLAVVHDGNTTYSRLSNVVQYGKLSGISPRVNDVSVGGKKVVSISWDNTPNCALYKEGDSRSVRIEIYEKDTSNLVKIVNYNSDEWNSKTWVYNKYDANINPNKKFAVKVVVGDNNVKGYSDLEWVKGGTTPATITNVVASKCKNNTTCEVSWVNPVEVDTIYNGVQVAWSENPDIWMTNNNPNTATFDNVNMTKVYITGLSSGNMYYFWVRNYRIEGEQTIYGDWSEMSAGVLMSEDPDIPVLTLSRSWVKEGSTLAAQWNYVASANCPQTEAKIEYSHYKGFQQLYKVLAKVDGEEDRCDIDTTVMEPYETGSSSVFELNYGSSSIKKYSNIMLYIDRNWINKDDILHVKWFYTDGTAYGALQKPTDVQNYTQRYAVIQYTSDDIYDNDITPIWNTLGDSAQNGEQELDINLDSDIKCRRYYIKMLSTHEINGSIVSLESNPIPLDIVNRHYLRVVVSNNHGSTPSEPVELILARKPRCVLQPSNSLTTVIREDTSKEIKVLEDSYFSVYVAGTGTLNLYLYVLDTFEHERPDKTDILYENDCVWSATVEEGEYTILGANLVDNCKYRLQLECTDPDTSLTADPQYVDFEVHWSHQAVAPAGSKILVGYKLDSKGDYILNKETGEKIIDEGAAYLIPVKPKGADETDVCDIYRSTSDGRYLCKKDVPWGSVIRDVLPSFGDEFEHSYCFCTRTKNGDEEWIDIPYELKGTGTIINYGDDSIALPWDVTIDDNRTKQGETRYHLGGSKAYYALPYIERSVNINAKLVKNENEDLVEKLYDLSRFSNVCYVRTSNNLGYPATVDVSINREFNNQILSISLSIKETEVKDEYFGDLITE